MGMEGKTTDSSTRAFWKYYQQSSSSKASGISKENYEFSLQNLLSCFETSLTWRRILWHGADIFTSPLKEGVLRIFIALEFSSPLARFEPANLESNGQHANQYTTEDDSSEF
jgi:hypothetical protein